MAGVFPGPARASFHRFVEGVAPGNRWHETKVAIASETRNVLFAPYKSRAKEVKVTRRGTLSVGAVADISKLNPDALGIRIGYEELSAGSNVAKDGTLRYAYVPLPEARDERALAALRIKVLRLHWRTRRVVAWAREVLPLPREYVTNERSVPQSARLDFGIGLEDEGQDTPVRFTIDVERDGTRATIFSKDLAPLSDEYQQGWVDASLDLSELAGSKARFAFRTESVRDERTAESESDTAPFSSPVWSSPVLYSVDAKREDSRPNVVLISLDTLRADHMGCYGYHRDTSPKIDAFAEGAFLFEYAIAPSSWTLPSHASVFTGLHPSVHGAVLHPWGSPIRETEKTLAELAREDGYVTAAYTEGAYVGSPFGFAQGFELYSDGAAISTLGSAEETFAHALEWLRAYRKLPFFLFVHTYQTHAPYAPPDRFAAMFDRGYTGSIGNSFMPSESGVQNLSDADKRHAEALYDGEIAYTDEVVAGFLNRLRQMGLLDTTAVIIFSDHGEEFWEHGGVQHGVTLYEEQLRVPLIIRLAGETPPAGRVPRQVSLTDLYATVAEIIGVAHDDIPDCTSLLPLMAGSNERKRYDRKTVVSEVCHRDTCWDHMVAKWRRRSVRTDGEKYIVSEKDGAEELYDLRADPREDNNTGSNSPSRLQQYREMLDSFLKAVAADGVPKSPVEGKARAITGEQKDRLRSMMKALGYI